MGFGEKFGDLGSSDRFSFAHRLALMPRPEQRRQWLSDVVDRQPLRKRWSL